MLLPFISSCVDFKEIQIQSVEELRKGRFKRNIINGISLDLLFAVDLLISKSVMERRGMNIVCFNWDIFIKHPIFDNILLFQVLRT